MKANMTVYITRTITDTKTGKVIKRYRKKQSKSFVKAFMQHLEAMMAHAYNAQSDSVTIKDTSNTERSVNVYTTDSQLYFGVEAPVNTDTYGVQIGTGTTAPAVADYTIETQIAHGTGAGEMEHGATGVGSATVSGSDMEMTITRAFVNNSGGAITVKEVGLTAETQSTWMFLLLRDAVNDAVADGQTYTVTYTFTTTV